MPLSSLDGLEAAEDANNEYFVSIIVHPFATRAVIFHYIVLNTTGNKEWNAATKMVPGERKLQKHKIKWYHILISH